MREIIIFDQDDLTKLCSDEEVYLRMNNGQVLTFVSAEGFKKRYRSSKFSKTDIQEEAKKKDKKVYTYKRLIAVGHIASAKKICDLLSDFDAAIVDSIFGTYGNYRIVHFRASKEDFNAIVQGLNLKRKSIPITNAYDARKMWFYEDKEV